MSGTGTILDAIIHHDVPVDLVVADRPCRGVENAQSMGITHAVVSRTFGPDFDRDAYSETIATLLGDHQIDLVVMAGWGTVFSEPMHRCFGGRILNTHPSLLPAFPGWHAVHDALDYGVKLTGCTVHVAGLVVDTGQILAQRAVEVLPGDDESSLHERIKSVERELYPSTIRAVIDGSIPLFTPHPADPTSC